MAVVGDCIRNLPREEREEGEGRITERFVTSVTEIAVTSEERSLPAGEPCPKFRWSCSHKEWADLKEAWAALKERWALDGRDTFGNLPSTKEGE